MPTANPPPCLRLWLILCCGLVLGLPGNLVAEPAVTYGIHLESYRDMPSLAPAFETLKSRLPEAMQGLTFAVASIDLGPEKGRYLRLIVGPFPDAASASARLALFKTRGQYAQVVAYPEASSAPAPERALATAPPSAAPPRKSPAPPPPTPPAAVAQTPAKVPTTTAAANWACPDPDKTRASSFTDNQCRGAVPRAKKRSEQAEVGNTAAIRQSDGQKPAFSAGLIPGVDRPRETAESIPANNEPQGDRKGYAGVRLPMGQLSFTPGVSANRSGDFGPYMGLGITF